jgi:hypothetical protein
MINTFNHKNKLKNIALQVHEGLRLYISVHDYIFHESSTLISTVKNIFGVGKPMSSLLEESKELIPIWDSIKKEMEIFESDDYNFLTQDEKKYFNILLIYVNSLRKAVDCLVERQRLMNQWSKSFINNPISWRVFKEKNRSYRVAIEEYQKIGSQLNALDYLIFSDPF